MLLISEAIPGPPGSSWLHTTTLRGLTSRHEATASVWVAGAAAETRSLPGVSHVMVTESFSMVSRSEQLAVARPLPQLRLLIPCADAIAVLAPLAVVPA